MNFIKYYWFNILIALIIIFGMVMTLIVAFSPREDNLKRGFIPCTEELADNILSCGGSLWCATKAVIKNSMCDADVIFNGFTLWIKGQQKTPWSNYIFTPDLSHKKDLSDTNSEIFYQENPNYLQDFEELKQTNKKLEEETQNDTKNNQ